MLLCASFFCTWVQAQPCSIPEDCDDGQFCNGLESCVSGFCQPGTPVELDDGVSCTVDSCDEVNDVVIHTPDDGICDNGQFCDGVETCDVIQDCQAGTAPCEDDGFFCNGTEGCDEGNDQCTTTGDPCPDDGFFCNGTEGCDEGNDQCTTTGDPCPDDGFFCNGTEGCDEGSDQCTTTGDPCSDGNACTDDICDEANDTCDNQCNASDYTDSCCVDIVCSAEPVCEEPDEKPNVIIFLTDDQGYQDLGCYNSPLIETPVIDQLADQGIRFTSFYSGASICTPSRAALMTGCYPARVGLSDWVLYPSSNVGLNLDETTIAELLKTQGYATAIIGKWHLGSQVELFPTRQGFDYYLGIPYSNNMYPVPLYENENLIDILEPVEEQEQLTGMYTDVAIQFITENQDSPFFLYIAYAMPHIPLNASDDFKGTSDRGVYGDVIEEIDYNVGRIRDTLQNLALDHKTLMIFFSDNGPWLEMGDNAGSPLPFKGGKESHWEGGFRVPCIMWWPGSIPGGQVSDEIVALIDFYPTLAALAGAELPTGQIGGVDIIIDGRNIWPLMSGEPGATSPHEAFYYDLGAVRSGKWKLKDDMLFDLEIDPHEDNDVSSQYPEKVSELQQMLDDFSQEVHSNQRPAGIIPRPNGWGEASTLGTEPRSLSVLVNCLLLFLLSIGAVALCKVRSRKK